MKLSDKNIRVVHKEVTSFGEQNKKRIYKNAKNRSNYAGNDVLTW